MAPGGDLHEELSAIMGIDRKKARETQRLMDSTAHIHGGRHRHDEIHSPEGVAKELLLRGQFTPEHLLAAYGHAAQDATFDALWKTLPVRGPLRSPTKRWMEAVLVEMMRGNRRRR